MSHASLSTHNSPPQDQDDPLDTLTPNYQIDSHATLHFTAFTRLSGPGRGCGPLSGGWVYFRPRSIDKLELSYLFSKVNDVLLALHREMGPL